MRYRFTPVTTACACLLTLFACGDAARLNTAADGWSGTVDTLESGRIVVRNPDESLWKRSEGLALRERFRVGSLDGDGQDLFGDIRDIELGPSGALYVLDGQAEEVRVFGPDGDYLRTLGRSGQGPGELRRPAGMTFDPDGTLWILNWGNARYTGFDPSTGEVVKERRRLVSFTVIPWPGRFDREGRLLDIGLTKDGQQAILRLDTAFVPHDTLLMPEAHDESQISFLRDGQRVMAVPTPFTPQPTWSPRPEGGIVVGEGDAYRLHRVEFDADTVMTIEVLRELVPVTRAERDSALAAFEETARMAGGARPDREPRIPAAKPAHGPLFVDDQDRIWVRRTLVPGTVAAWDVIADDGRLLGQVPIPDLPAYGMPAIRGNLFALVLQPDGVPTVVVYDLVEVKR